MSFAIENLRKNADLTQQELAEKMNVTQGVVSQWELGLSKPSSDKLPELARIFNCKIDDLFAS